MASKLGRFLAFAQLLSAPERDEGHVEDHDRGHKDGHADTSSHERSPSAKIDALTALSGESIGPLCSTAVTCPFVSQA